MFHSTEDTAIPIMVIKIYCEAVASKTAKNNYNIFWLHDLIYAVINTIDVIVMVIIVKYLTVTTDKLCSFKRLSVLWRMI